MFGLDEDDNTDTLSGGASHKPRRGLSGAAAMCDDDDVDVQPAPSAPSAPSAPQQLVATPAPEQGQTAGFVTTQPAMSAAALALLLLGLYLLFTNNKK